MIRKASLALTALVAAAGAVTATPSEASAQRNVTCESRSNDRMYCTSDVRGGVRMIRQLSRTACITGRTWGTDRRGLWVAYGCRAEFRVGDGYGSGGGSSVWDRARDRNGDGRYDDRDRERDGRYDDRYDRRSERALANQAERVCRRAVRDRYRVRNSAIDADFRRTRDTRLSSVRWTAGRLRGTCVVDHGGRLVRFSADRRR